MKSLKSINTVVTGNKVTITAEIEERTFSSPAQQVTMLHFADNNPKWVRHVHVSNDAVFVKLPNTKHAVAIPLEDLVTKIAAVIEPKTSHAPRFMPQKQGPLSVEVASELNPSLQWQAVLSSTVPQNSASWTNVEGATGKTIAPDALKGHWVRCVASSESGETYTAPFLIK